MRRALASIIIIGVVISLVGLAGQGLTAAQGEEVTPFTYGEELILAKGKPYWATYADYEARLLTVPYKLTNISAEALHDLVIMEATASDGVTIYTDPLPALGDLEAGASLDFTLVWNVPEGVNGFNTNTPVGSTYVAPHDDGTPGDDGGAGGDNYGDGSGNGSAAGDNYGENDPPVTPRLTPALTSVDVPPAPARASLPSTGLDLWPW